MSGDPVEDPVEVPAGPRAGPRAEPGTDLRARLGPAVAAMVALGLGALAALFMIAGHHAWDGPTIDSGTGSHGLHRGDVIAIFPIVVSMSLAWWCWTRER